MISYSLGKLKLTRIKNSMKHEILLFTLSTVSLLWDAATKYQTEVICLIGAELSSTGVMYVVTDGLGILEVSACVVTNIYKATPHSGAFLCQ